MTTTLEAMQSQALVYQKQQIRDLVDMVQALYENCFDTASVATLQDAYNMLVAHGADPEYFTEPDAFMPLQACHKDSYTFHDKRGS